jgi:hypothetical protein
MLYARRSPGRRRLILATCEVGQDAELMRRQREANPVRLSLKKSHPSSNLSPALPRPPIPVILSLDIRPPAQPRAARRAGGVMASQRFLNPATMLTRLDAPHSSGSLSHIAPPSPAGFVRITGR